LNVTTNDILLTAPDGVTLIDHIAYGQQTNDMSEGRYSDGASVRYFMPKPTPYRANVPGSGPNGIPDYNTGPVIPVPNNQTVTNGQRVSVRIVASDPDVPPQTLAYTLDAGPPGGLVLQSGVFFWSVPTNQPAGDYPVQCSVADNGSPPKSDTVNFILTVAARGTISTLNPGPFIQSVAAAGGQATFTIQTIPGRAYRVLYKNDLNDPTWLQLAPDFAAANTNASLTDSFLGARRFYQVLQLN
jgi:hypothetical protein